MAKNRNSASPEVAECAAEIREGRKRRTFPHVLEVLVDAERTAGYGRADDSPDFDATADAIAWAEDKGMTGKFRVVQIKATGTLEAKTVTKAKVE